MPHYFTGLLLAVSGTLGACNTTPSVDHQPVTGDQTAPVDTTATLDTLATSSSGAAPFVVPTRVGRALGPQSPSPVGSRTH